MRLQIFIIGIYLKVLLIILARILRLAALIDSVLKQNENGCLQVLLKERKYTEKEQKIWLDILLMTYKFPCDDSNESDEE